MPNFLNTDIKFISGVGAKKAEILNKEIDIFTIDDLLRYYPYKYIDRSNIYSIIDIQSSMLYIQLKGYIASFEKIGEGRKKRLVAHFTDGTGFIDLVWFQGIKFVEDKYKTNIEYIVFGKPSKFGNKWNISHPEIDFFKSYTPIGFSALYNTTEKMKTHYLSSKAIQKIISTAISNINTTIPESLSTDVISQANLISLNEALRNIHFPKNMNDLKYAEFRLKFEELFYIQLNILQYTSNQKSKLNGFVLTVVGKYFNTFYTNYLPFKLTDAQKRVIKEIRKDLNSGIQMNRLLQGDVGSGKTLVALLCILIAVDNGFQTCIMAPTEILATQHYYTFRQMLSEIGINIALLTGSSKKKERDTILYGLKNKEINILIGTHAIIEDTVVFNNLGFVVIDEQHRFGVVQRSKLWKKNYNPPHILVMTATPIPRTLAMTLYGDLDISIIDELPPGRKPIKTIHLFEEKKRSLYEFIKLEIDKGRQVYIVYPLIEESEKIDLQDLENGYEEIKNIFPDYSICKMHGKMKSIEKKTIMDDFVLNKYKIMVSTTVIEVGVNVPNASIMIIQGAQRFGLSQLHQLRGRVGRGAEQSFCILITPYEISSDTRRRMSVMTESSDGFVIAEEDLRLRGPGDLEGTQQSGIPFNLKIANIVKDGNIVIKAREIAENIIKDDPKLEHANHQILKTYLKKLSGNRYDWGRIS